MSAATLPATPYLTLLLIPLDGSAPCRVSSGDEYNAAVARYNAAGTEEWEVSVVDGTAHRSERAALRTACQTMPPDEVFALAGWLESADEHGCVAAYYLLQHCSNGYDCARDVIDAVADVQLYKGSGAEYAEKLATDCGDLRNVPNFLRYHIDWEVRYHIDWEGVARDMKLSGGIHTFSCYSRPWTVTNAAEV